MSFNSRLMRGRSLLLPASLLVIFLVSTKVIAGDDFDFQEAVNLLPLDESNRQTVLQIHAGIPLWQGSGVFVESGKRYRVNADGAWQLGPLCNPTGPDGTSPYTIACWDFGPTTRAVAESTHSALIAKIGRSGQAFATGKMIEFTAQQSGILYFMANDAPGWFGDNSGKLDVTIELAADHQH